MIFYNVTYTDDGGVNLNSVKNFKDNGYVIIPKLLSKELSNFWVHMSMM